jgi:hypothetical protein
MAKPRPELAPVPLPPLPVCDAHGLTCVLTRTSEVYRIYRCPEAGCIVEHRVLKPSLARRLRRREGA